MIKLPCSFAFSVPFSVALTVICSLLQAASAYADMDSMTDRSELDRVVSNFQQAIYYDQDGLSYKQGSIHLITRSDCTLYVPIFGHCFGNNPAAPYILPAFPQSEGEYIDPYYGNQTAVAGTPDHRPAWRLRKDQANVIIGITPPRGAYFGFQTYLMSRHEEPSNNVLSRVVNLVDPNVKELLFRSSPNPDRVELFSSLGNSINSSVIAKKMGVESGFGKLVAFVTTGDKELSETIKQTLLASGLEESQIFIEKIADSMRFGLEQEDDDFLSLLRYALPDPVLSNEANDYREALPFVVMRITPDQLKSDVEGYKSDPYGERQGVSERYLASARDNLADEILKEFGQRAKLRHKPFIPASLIGLNGQNCMATVMNCLGDTQDTDTYRISPRGYLNDRRTVIAVVGIDHTSTGNATYVSLSINHAEELRGVTSVSQTAEVAGFLSGPLRGSAEKFLLDRGRNLNFFNRAHASKLYLHFFSRDCSGLSSCTVITEDSVTGIPYGTGLSIMQRAYLYPGDTLGAAPGKLESPIFLQFQR